MLFSQFRHRIWSSTKSTSCCCFCCRCRDKERRGSDCEPAAVAAANPTEAAATPAAAFRGEKKRPPPPPQPSGTTLVYHQHQQQQQQQHLGKVGIPFPSSPPLTQPPQMGVASTGLYVRQQQNFQQNLQRNPAQQQKRSLTPSVLNHHHQQQQPRLYLRQQSLTPQPYHFSHNIRSDLAPLKEPAMAPNLGAQQHPISPNLGVSKHRSSSQEASPRFKHHPSSSTGLKEFLLMAVVDFFEG